MCTRAASRLVSEQPNQREIVSMGRQGTWSRHISNVQSVHGTERLWISVCVMIPCLFINTFQVSSVTVLLTCSLVVLNNLLKWIKITLSRKNDWVEMWAHLLSAHPLTHFIPVSDSLRARGGPLIRYGSHLPRYPSGISLQQNFKARDLNFCFK